MNFTSCPVKEQFLDQQVERKKTLRIDVLNY